jgi:transposase
MFWRCVGPMLATALVASVANPRTFRSGRNFSAWIGLVPTQHSSGGKDRLGSISKQGDRYLRSLFVAGALAVIRYAKIHGTKHRPWLAALLARRPTKVAAIALANKIARMAWAHDGQGRALQATLGTLIHGGHYASTGRTHGRTDPSLRT